MQDIRLGAAFRAVRLRRGWRQADVALRAGVSRSLVSLIERGHLDTVSLAILRRIAAVLDIRIDLVARWRGGELDRLLNAGHSTLHESVSAFFADMPGWLRAPEVSFSIDGERGVIDILAFHIPSRSLLVIELKTALVDVNELLGVMDRKQRLAARIAADRGWQPATVSAWVVFADDRTTQRRLAAHRSVLRAAFPQDGRHMRAWLRDPTGSVRALSSWPYAVPHSVASPGRQRVRRSHTPADAR
jgi:transcriptional regulator with XRE-family HTH domain